MENLTAILVVLDRSARDAPLLTKSLVLAREFNARVELFSCDAEHEYALRHSYDKSGVAAARQACILGLRDYLRQCCDQFIAKNVVVTIDAVCESPLYEGVIRKVSRSAPDLVVKAAALESFEGRGALDFNDWQLASMCPVPLLLSRGGVWPARPRFAAAVDASAEETPGLAEKILRTAEYLRAGYQGELDVLFGERTSIDRRTRRRTADTLRRLARELHFAAERIRALPGDAAAMVLAFEGEHHPDILVLGTLPYRTGVTAGVGTRTEELMRTLDCDLLLVKQSGLMSPVRDPANACATDTNHVESP